MYDSPVAKMTNNAILHSVSLDRSSGIETTVANMNASQDVNIPILTYTNEPTIEEVVLQPSTKVTLIPKNTENNSILQRINNLDDNSKFTIIGGLLLVSIVLIVISIFK